MAAAAPGAARESGEGVSRTSAVGVERVGGQGPGLAVLLVRGGVGGEQAGEDLLDERLERHGAGAGDG